MFDCVDISGFFFLSISDNKKTSSLIGNIESYVFTSILHETNDKD